VKLRHEEIIEFLTLGQRRSRQGQDIPAHPIGQGTHIRRQGQRLVFLPANQVELAAQGLSLTGPLDPLVFVLDLLASGRAGTSTIRQRRGQFRQALFGMKDVSVARQIAPRGLLAGPQGLAGIGNGIVQLQPAIPQFQQMHAPGRLIAVIYGFQQIAVGRGHIHPYQHRLRGLVNLIMGPDPNGREVLGVVEP